MPLGQRCRGAGGVYRWLAAGAVTVLVLLAMAPCCRGGAVVGGAGQAATTQAAEVADAHRVSGLPVGPSCCLHAQAAPCWPS
jgi:hypothetical protein